MINKSLEVFTQVAHITFKIIIVKQCLEHLMPNLLFHHKPHVIRIIITITW